MERHRGVGNGPNTYRLTLFIVEEEEVVVMVLKTPSSR